MGPSEMLIFMTAVALALFVMLTMKSYHEAELVDASNKLPRPTKPKR